MRAYSHLAFFAGQELKGGFLLLTSRWAFCGFKVRELLFSGVLIKAELLIF